MQFFICFINVVLLPISLYFFWFQLVVTDLCVIIGSKSEVAPHSFNKIDKSLNRGALNNMLGADVFVCFKRSMNRPDSVCYKPGLLSRFPHKDHGIYSVPDHVPLFCLPMGATLECWPTGMTTSCNLSTSTKYLLTYMRVFNLAYLTPASLEGFSEFRPLQLMYLL